MFPLIEKLEEIRAEQQGIKEAIELLDMSGVSDGITGLIGLLDPRLVILIELLDSIDDVLGGVYEPPALP